MGSGSIKSGGMFGMGTEITVAMAAPERNRVRLAIALREYAVHIMTFTFGRKLHIFRP
jgi:hypothetical protein